MIDRVLMMSPSSARFLLIKGPQLRRPSSLFVGQIVHTRRAYATELDSSDYPFLLGTTDERARRAEVERKMAMDRYQPRVYFRIPCSTEDKPNLVYAEAGEDKVVGCISMSGTTEEMLPSYLDEFQWRQLYGKKTAEAFNNILAQIAHYYPV